MRGSATAALPSPAHTSSPPPPIMQSIGETAAVDDSATTTTTTTAAASVTPTLVAEMRGAVEDSLRLYLYHDAIFYSERLLEVQHSYRHLHILADCLARSGDTISAVRLLQQYYPFFEANVLRPASAGPSSRRREAYASSSSSSSPVTATATRGDGSRGMPIDTRSTVRHFTASVSGETTGFLTQQSVDLEARWDCNYLYAVCCCQTARYNEGRRAMTELLRVADRLENFFVSSPVSFAAPPSSTSTATSMEGREKRCFWRGTSAVLYWLGVCEKQLHLDSACDSFEKAVSAVTQPYGDVTARLRHDEPLRFQAFCEYIHTSPNPHERCLAIFTPEAAAAVSNETSNEDGSGCGSGEYRVTPTPAGRTNADVHWDPSSGASCATRTIEAKANDFQVFSGMRTCAERREPEEESNCVADVKKKRRQSAGHAVLLAYLKPFAQVVFLLGTYRCSEAQKLLRAFPTHLDLVPQPESPGATRASAIVVDEEGEPEEEGGGRGRYPGATTSSQQYERRTPVPSSEPSPWTLTQLALAYFHDGDMASSSTVFAQLLEEAPWRLAEPSLVLYSTALWQLKAEGALRALAQRLTEEAPLSAISLCVVGNAYSLAREPADALVMFHRAVQVDASMAYAHALRGYELLYLDRKAEAAEAFKTAIYWDRKMYTAYAGVGEIYFRDEELYIARQYFQTAISLNPHPAIMNRFAATYHRRDASTRELQDALRIFEASLRLHPGNLSARHQRADVLLRIGRYEEAQSELLAMIATCPTEAMLYVTLARCLQCVGERQQAVQCYHRAMNLDPRREGYFRNCMERLAAATSTPPAQPL